MHFRVRYKMTYFGGFGGACVFPDIFFGKQ